VQGHDDQVRQRLGSDGHHSQRGTQGQEPWRVGGWNNLTLGGSIDDLAPGASKSVRQTLNIKCVEDAEFEIHYTANDGGDFTQVFSNKNIKDDKNAVLTLTHH
jgi:hypothetical protein